MRIVFFLRSLIAAIIFVPLTILWCLLAIVTMTTTGNMKYGDWIVGSWGRFMLKLINVKWFVDGLENIPPGGCLFLFNHSSLFDIMVISGAVPKTARFGAKIELFSVPFFGPAMKAMGVLPITRSDRSKVLKLYTESIARVTEKGESFFLAAEGGRNPTAGIGENFKSGPFIFAINGQFPIVPWVVYGAAECLQKGDIIPCTRKWSYTIRMRVLPPISTVGLTEDDRDQLKVKARESMVKTYQELEQLGQLP